MTFTAPLPLSKAGNPDQKPDPAALELAGRTRTDEELDTVILFGSRARGDHQPDSDIDLLIPSPWVPNDARIEVLTQRAEARARQLYDHPPEIQLVFMHTGECRRTLHAVNTLTARAVQDGSVFTDNTSAWTYRGPDQAQETAFTRSAAEAALDRLKLLGETRREDRSDFLEHWYQAHHAIRNAAMAALSAAGERIHHRAELMELIEKLNRHPGHRQPVTNVPWATYQAKGNLKDQEGHYHVNYHNFTKLVQEDVDQILLTNHELHRWTRRVLKPRLQARRRRQKNANPSKTPNTARSA